MHRKLSKRWVLVYNPAFTTGAPMLKRLSHGCHKADLPALELLDGKEHCIEEKDWDAFSRFPTAVMEKPFLGEWSTL